MKEFPKAILDLAMSDASIYTAVNMYRKGVLTYEAALENLVEILGKQKKELQDMNIKLAETSIAPKKFYVNMSKKEIEKLKENGSIQLLKQPVYEDTDND